MAKLDVLFELRSLDMAGQGTLPLEVKVAATQLTEESLGLKGTLPNPTPSKLRNEGYGIGLLWHFGAPVLSLCLFFVIV